MKARGAPIQGSLPHAGRAAAGSELRARGVERMRRATSSGSSSCGKCLAVGNRNSSEFGNFSWKSRATPAFKYGSASPKMILTGRPNAHISGSAPERELVVPHRSAFSEKNAGLVLGVAANCSKKSGTNSSLTSSSRMNLLPTCHQYILRKRSNLPETNRATFLKTGVEKRKIASGGRAAGVRP